MGLFYFYIWGIMLKIKTLKYSVAITSRLGSNLCQIEQKKTVILANIVTDSTGKIH